MFRLAVPKGVHDNRVNSYLKNKEELMETEDFQREADSEGLVHYVFPDMEEDNFRYIVIQLKNQGVTMIGVDSQLTEKKIMKLTNLLNELAPTTEEVNRPKYLEIMKKNLQTWKKTQYADDKTRAEMFYEDMKALVEEWEGELDTNKGQGAYDKTNKMVSENKNKLRNLIRKTIRK